MSRHAGDSGRTNWRRFAAAFGTGAVVSAGLVVLMANGALAADFKVSGQQFKVSADSLDGEGFAQYGWVDAHADDTGEAVAISAIKDAKLKNMCQSVLTSLPIVGDVTLRIAAGAGNTPAHATDMFIDMSQLEGDAEFTKIEIGRDASTLDKGPAGGQGFQGFFAQQSDHVHIDKLRQVAWSANAGKFTLPGLKLSVEAGNKECF